MPATVLTIARDKIRIADVNRMAKKDAAELFGLCNQKYEKKLESIARRIAENPEKSRLIMLSGPSASGKTTTSLKLQAQLRELGCGAVAISMDDFFRDRADAPRLPDGTFDFESAAALDTDLLKTSLTSLITEGRALIPVFNFRLGRRNGERPVILEKGQVAVVEGLHALNPMITGLLPQGSVLKLYVSVSSDFVSDGGQVALSARDLRLIRRAVRDFRFRGASVAATLDMWDSVCRGEDLYVRPYKKCADLTVNSAFSCEPCLFSGAATELFSSAADSMHSERVKHVLDGLAAFEPMPTELMPESCVLREFLGGSVYYGRSNRPAT